MVSSMKNEEMQVMTAYSRNFFAEMIRFYSSIMNQYLQE